MICHKIGEANIVGTRYKILRLYIDGVPWTFTQGTGLHNIVAIRNESMPLAYAREFTSWDEACKAYNSASVKVAILWAECSMKYLN